MLAVGIFVFDVTGSPLLVAAFTMLRMLPLALFGAFAGALGGRFDRRLMLLAGLAALAALSLGIGVLGATGRLAVWHVGVAGFLAGVMWAVDFPLRRTLLGDVAGTARIGRAMSLDTIASSGTRMIGPLLGGALYAAVGLHGAFLITGAGYAAAFLVLLSLHHRDSTQTAAGSASWSVAASVRAGLAALRRAPVLGGILAITVAYNIWGFPILSMVPVIGKEVLYLGPFAIGLLASMEGLGSLTGAVALALFARQRYYRHLYMAGTGGFLVLAVGFANLPLPLLAGVVLFGMGIAMSAFAAMQSALLLLNAPSAVRSQMMGLLSLCIGAGPLGLAHLGLMAHWFGAQVACTVVALEGIVVVALATAKWRELVAPQPPP